MIIREQRGEELIWEGNEMGIGRYRGRNETEKNLGSKNVERSEQQRNKRYRKGETDEVDWK